MAEPVYQVVITSRAEASLEQILDYLADEVSLQTAIKVRDELEKAIRSLSKMPQRNTILPDISDEQIVYRRIQRWNYRVIYTIEENELLVLVVEVDYAKRDPQKLKEQFGK
jgi:plasmid stabilization system protein ParE